MSLMFAAERWIKIVEKRYAGPRWERVKLRSRPRSCDDTALFERRRLCLPPPLEEDVRLHRAGVHGGAAASEILRSC